MFVVEMYAWSFRGASQRPLHLVVGGGSAGVAPGAAPIAPMSMQAGPGPAPSTISMAAANAPQGQLPQSQNRAPCNQAPAGSVPTGTLKTQPVMTPSIPGRFFMTRVGSVPGGVGAGPMGTPMAAAPVPMAPSNACVVGAASAPEAENKTGSYIAIAIGGIFGLVTIAAIVQKYKTMGSYSSFWGRMVALASGAAAFALGYMNVSDHSANSCSNLFGDPFMSSPCPCLSCAYVLFAYGVFQLVFNLPYLYASEKSISNMYAKFGLFNQAALELTVSGGCTAGIKFMSGALSDTVICALGVVTAVLFFLGYFKGEDGVLSRMFQSAKDMLNGAATAAAAMVDDGLKVFGLNADERNKVTLNNVYNFARVVRGPDWSAGDDDGGPEGPGGEIIGYIGENGIAEGVPVSAGQPGWAKVKWDPKLPGQPGKTGEYRIGAGNKYELKMAEETDGIVDKLMGQTFAMFGYDPSTTKTPPKEKQQIEFILTSRLPGEEEPETEADLKDDSADEADSSPKNEAAAAKKAQAAAEAASKEMLVMVCDLYDKTGKTLGRCDDLKQMLYKGAVRHRNLGNKQEAIVVELQKLPQDVSVVALSVKLPEGRQLGYFGSVNIRATSQGHDLSKLSVSPAEGLQGIQKHQGSRGYLWFLLYTPEPGKWYAEKTDTSLGSGQAVDALYDQVQKFISAREPKRPKSKKKIEEYEASLVGGKSVDKLISIGDIFDYLKIELRCEAQARELMATKVNALTEAYATRLKAQGVPPAQASLQAKKIALIQINKQHQLLYQKTLIVRRAMYLKQRIHPVHALLLAKKDANRAALYDGKEAEIKRAVMNTIKEEKDAADQAKKDQEAEYANTYAGQATSLVSNVWNWANSTSEEPTEKKKKKKKKKDDGKEEEAKPAAALPPQFANLSPEQIAAIRALQAKQLAAKQQNV